MTAKLGFRKWLELEEHRKKLSEATERNEFPDLVFAYLSVASDVPAKEEAWENTVFILLKTFKENQPRQDIPLLKDAPRENGKPVSWDYEGRGFWLWSNVLCKAYGWDLEYVSGLDVNDAFSLIQEILTDDQLEREFYYSLSEIAYPYNKSTKRSVYKPMPRPYWMKVAIEPIKRHKYPRDMLPYGLVMDVSGMPLEMNPLRDTVVVQNNQTETKNEKTNSSSNP